MRLLLWARQTGKTTECIKALKKHKDAFCVVRVKSMEMTFPKKLRKRVFSSYQDLNELPFKKVIIDEVDLIDTFTVKDLIRNYKLILIAGTPLYLSPNFPWLVKKYKVNKKTKPNKEVKKLMSKTSYDSEMLCKFRV